MKMPFSKYAPNVAKGKKEGRKEKKWWGEKKMEMGKQNRKRESVLDQVKHKLKEGFCMVKL